MQAVHAAVRKWVAEMQAGGPATKAPAATEERPADAAARAATAKAEAESRAQVPPPPAGPAPPALCVARMRSGSRSPQAARTGGRLHFAQAQRRQPAHAALTGDFLRAQLEAAKKAAARREAAEEAAGTASIALTERYVARPADLLACFTEAQRVMAFTQAPAQARHGTFAVQPRERDLHLEA